MLFKHFFFTFHLTSYWSVFAHEDTKCTDDKDCVNDNGFCHKITHLCICENGESMFPSCTRNECTTCNEMCDPLEFFDNDENKCKCRFGGMSTKTCCKQQCGKIQTCNDGRCVCRFGENKISKQCNRCKEDCGRTATCKEIDNIYVCVCENGGTFPNCIRNDDFQWSPWGNCGVTCGSGKQTKAWCSTLGLCLDTKAETRECNIQDRPCIGSWGPWKAWSSCSRTCGKGKRQRRRSCITTQPCMKGRDYDSQNCQKTRCLRKTIKKEIKWCQDNCRDFRYCNGNKCAYHCRQKLLKKCRNCRHGCPPPSPPVDCQWCPWSQPKVVKNDADCHYFEKRFRTTTCPAASEGGRPCEGPAEETVKEVTERTPPLNQDFHPVHINSIIIFHQVCVNGCNFVDKVFYGCGMIANDDDTRLVKQACHLKETCNFPLKSSFFNNRVVPCNPASAWITISCIGGPGVKAVKTP